MTLTIKTDLVRVKMISVKGHVNQKLLLEQTDKLDCVLYLDTKVVGRN